MSQSRQIDLNALIAKFEAIDIAENVPWVSLHEKIVDYRKKKLTISDFLKACGLNSDKSYFKQLACNTGHKLIPSKLDGSVGKEFTDAVTEFFKPDATITVEQQEQSLAVLIEEWVLDNCDMLEEMKIQSIAF